jgi:hypothetical protein
MAGESRSYNCPGCGAKLPVPAAGGKARCEFCGTQVDFPALGSPAGSPTGPPTAVPALGLPSMQRPAFQPPTFQPPGPFRPPRKSRAKLFLILPLVLCGAGALAYFIFYMSWSRVDGKVVSEGGPLGTFSAPIDECRSGAAFVPQFFGVDLKAESPVAHVQVQDSGDKATVVVGGPQGEEPHLDLTKAECSKFDVFVEWGNAEVNDVSTVEGRVHIDCAPAGGGRVRVDAEFKACH